MQIYTALSDVPAAFGPSVVSIGKFDGVHKGHQQIIRRLRAIAEAEALTATVVTFNQNPLRVLAPDACPADLVSNAQKLALLENSGVGATVMLEFTRRFSENSPREFVETMLVDALNAKVVLVGADFRFGRYGAGDVTLLHELGDQLAFRVELLQDFGLPESVASPNASATQTRRVSSTWVRQLLSAGDVAAAAELLGREHTVRSVVVRGAQRGRQLGFPTANLAPDAEGFVPADGVYSAWVTVGDSRYRAAVSIGNNPTFDGGAERQVEAHLLGAGDDTIEIDLYGKTIDVHFISRLRGMLKFDTIDALITQMGDDVARVRALLPDEPAVAE